MEELEVPTLVVLSELLISKIIEWVPRKESKFIKVDPDFWTVDRYYLLQSLKIGAWFDAVMVSTNKQIEVSVSPQVAELLHWFQNRYQKSGQ